MVATSYSGGIITLWKRHISCVTPVAISRKALHLVISDFNNASWVISTICNNSRVRGQRLFWQELLGLSSLNLAWIIIDDFNFILYDNEHRGGSYRYYACKARLFSKFIASNDLLDVGFIGPDFTWCNKQSGLARHWARLDRYLVNTTWISKFDAYVINHLPRLFSDHAPLFLKASPRYFCKIKVFML